MTAASTPMATTMTTTMATMNRTRRRRTLNSNPFRASAILTTLIALAAACAKTNVARAFSSDARMRSTSFHDHKRKVLPEDVVAAQLQLLQAGDIQSAYDRFMTPESKCVTNHSWQTFAEEILAEPFSDIVGHDRASVILTVSGADEDAASKKHFTTCMCLVRVAPCIHGLPEDSPRIRMMAVPSKDGRSRVMQETVLARHYWWELFKYPSSVRDYDYDQAGYPSDSNDDDVWMIHSVIPDFESMEVDDIEVEEGLWADIMDQDLYDDDDDDDDDYDDDDDDDGFEPFF